MSTAEPSPRLRAAAVQAASEPNDLNANVAQATSWTRKAAEHGAAIAVFPELFLSGYHPPSWGRLREDVEIAADADGKVDDPRLDELCRAATEITLLIGAAVREDGRRRIATLLVDSDGARVVYRKQNLCGPEERSAFDPGEDGAVIHVDGWKLGVGICYDAAFPEHARAAARAGCLGYLSGGAFLRGAGHRRDLYHAARALDNTFYTVFAGAVGGTAPWTFGGGSAVYDPEGQSAATVEEDRAGIAVAVLELERVRQVRRDHTMLADAPSPR